MLERKVDGVAIMTSEMEDHLIRTFSRRQIPMVFMDVAPQGATDSVVRVNYEGGVKLAMEHLFELRHKDIAFISGPLGLASAQMRAHAFQQALENYRLASNPDWIQEGDHRVEGGAHAMERILRSGKRRPTAVLTSNDLTAIGAMGAIHEAGLRIPEDISIIGFDGIELSAYTQPALTTLFVSRGELASQAFRSLLQHKDPSARKATAKEHIIEPRLVVRGTTAPPPAPARGTSKR